MRYYAIFVSILLAISIFFHISHALREKIVQEVKIGAAKPNEREEGAANFDASPTSDCTQLAEQNVSLRKEIEKRMRPDEKFALSPKNAELETQFLHTVENALSSNEEYSSAYSAECHGYVCRLLLRVREDADLAIIEEILRSDKEFQRIHYGVMKKAGAPFSGENRETAEYESFYMIPRPDQISGQALLSDIVAQVKSSEEWHNCFMPEITDLQCMVSIDEKGHVTVRVTSKKADNEQIGCIRNAINKHMVISTQGKEIIPSSVYFN